MKRWTLLYETWSSVTNGKVSVQEAKTTGQDIRLTSILSKKNNIRTWHVLTDGARLSPIIQSLFVFSGGILMQNADSGQYGSSSSFDNIDQEQWRCLIRNSPGICKKLKTTYLILLLKQKVDQTTCIYRYLTKQLWLRFLLYSAYQQIWYKENLWRDRVPSNQQRKPE